MAAEIVKETVLSHAALWNLLLFLLVVDAAGAGALGADAEVLTTMVWCRPGDNVTVSCTESSTATTVSLTWYDGFIQLSTSPQHSLSIGPNHDHTLPLHISNVTIYHYGIYRCLAEIEGSVFLRKKILLLPEGATVVPEIVESSDSDDDFCQGNCAAKLGSDSVECNSEAAASQGKYLCTTVNGTVSRIYYLAGTDYLPLHFVSPVNPLQRYGDRNPPYLDTVNCAVSGGNGPIRINWYKVESNRPVLYFDRIRVDSVVANNSVSVLGLDVSSFLPGIDEGHYRCSASDGTRSIQARVELDYTVTDRFSNYVAYWPTNYTAIIGSNVSIPCYSMSYPEPNSRASMLIQDETGRTRAEHQDSSALTDYVRELVLELCNVSESNVGPYICWSFDGLPTGDSKDKSMHLSVIKDPYDITSFTLDRSSVREEGKVLLTCVVKVHPSYAHRMAEIIVEFTLHVKNQTGISPNSLRYDYDDFTINATAFLEDVGSYQCIVLTPGYKEVDSITDDDIQAMPTSSNTSLIVGLAVLAVVILMLVFTVCILISCFVHCPRRTGKKSYLTVVSKDKIGARLSASSCVSADFVIQRTLPGLLSEWMIPYARLQLDDEIGSGTFGVVNKAYLRCEDTNRLVAVKSLQENGGLGNTASAFHKEAKILRHVGHHKHVIGLLGISMCADQYLLVMEFAARGNLLQFLHQKRTDVEQPLSIRETFDFARQIALGMTHLASKNCIHCDLAARNVLITDNFVLKVSDFGLARKLYGSAYSKLTDKKVCLPVRWMAPESIKDLLFTTSSDVWSFGVILWEIFQLGTVPYCGVEDYKLLDQLQLGYRLEQPQYSTKEHYDLMLQCWNSEPCLRPTFPQLAAKIEQIVDTASSTEYVNWTSDIYDSECCSASSCGSSGSISSCGSYYNQMSACPVHGQSFAAEPIEEQTKPSFAAATVKRDDSGLPESPSDLFNIYKKTKFSLHRLEQTNV